MVDNFLNLFSLIIDKHDTVHSIRASEKYFPYAEQQSKKAQKGEE